jgi:flagellin-specific chaperone FliS
MEKIMEEILKLVKEAQEQLRATQINWQEECLFRCDEILTETITRLTQRTPDAGDSAA